MENTENNQVEVVEERKGGTGKILVGLLALILAISGSTYAWNENTQHKLISDSGEGGHKVLLIQDFDQHSAKDWNINKGGTASTNWLSDHPGLTPPQGGRGNAVSVQVADGSASAYVRLRLMEYMDIGEDYPYTPMRFVVDPVGRDFVTSAGTQTAAAALAALQTKYGTTLDDQLGHTLVIEDLYWFVPKFPSTATGREYEKNGAWFVASQGDGVPASETEDTADNGRLGAYLQYVSFGQATASTGDYVVYDDNGANAPAAYTPATAKGAKIIGTAAQPLVPGSEQIQITDDAITLDDDPAVGGDDARNDEDTPGPDGDISWSAATADQYAIDHGYVPVDGNGWVNPPPSDSARFRQYIQINYGPNVITYTDWLSGSYPDSLVHQNSLPAGYNPLTDTLTVAQRAGKPVNAWIIDNVTLGGKYNLPGGDGWAYWGSPMDANTTAADRMRTEFEQSYQLVLQPQAHFNYSQYVSMQAADGDAVDAWNVPDVLLQSWAPVASISMTQALKVVNSQGDPYILPGSTVQLGDAAVVTTSIGGMKPNQDVTWGVATGECAVPNSDAWYAASPQTPGGNNCTDSTTVPNVTIGSDGSLTVGSGATLGSEFYIFATSVQDSTVTGFAKLKVGSAVGAGNVGTLALNTTGAAGINFTRFANSYLAGIDTTDDATTTDPEGDVGVNVIPGSITDIDNKYNSLFQLPSVAFEDSNGVSWRVLKEQTMTDDEGVDHKYAFITTNFGDAFSAAQIKGNGVLVNNGGTYGTATGSGACNYGTQKIHVCLPFDNTSNLYDASNLDKAMGNIQNALATEIKNRAVYATIGEDADNTLPAGNQPMGDPATLPHLTTDIANTAQAGKELDSISEPKLDATADATGIRKVFALSIAEALTTPLLANSPACISDIYYVAPPINHRCTNYHYPASKVLSNDAADPGNAAGMWFRNATSTAGFALGATQNMAITGYDIYKAFSMSARPALWIQLD